MLGPQTMKKTTILNIGAVMAMANVCITLSSCEEDITRETKATDNHVATRSTLPIKCSDSALEAAVSQLLQKRMTERDCTKGLVYVAEAATGAIKAHVSLERNGDGFSPCEDPEVDEQSVLMAGPTYLILLSSGMYCPGTFIETGNGTYKNVRDYNWKFGGYGRITLERAVELRSAVAFAIAKDAAFGHDPASFDSLQTAYLAGMPDRLLGMLTFYNAVANYGHMVQLHSEGTEVVTINDKIAAPRHVRALQQAMRSAVEKGGMDKAFLFSDVAACGRNIRAEGDRLRMELCGFFPTTHPKYTIMVVLERYKIPAKAEYICGPVMAGIIDFLYQQHGM